MIIADYLAELLSRREQRRADVPVRDVIRIAGVEGIAIDAAVAELFTCDECLEILPGFWALPIEGALARRRVEIDGIEPIWRDGWLPFAEQDGDCLVVATDVKGMPVMHLPEALGPIVLYESLAECFTIHLRGIRAGAIRCDATNDTLAVDPAAFARIHREHRHGDGELTTVELLAISDLVTNVDQPAVAFCRSAHLDLVLHLYPEAVPGLVRGISTDHRGRRLDILTRTQSPDARSAVSDAVRSDPVAVVGRLFELPSLSTEIVDLVHHAIGDTRVEGHGRSRLRMLLKSRHLWDPEDVIEALTDADADSRRFAAEESGWLRLMPAAPLLRSALQGGTIAPIYALVALARIEGEAAFPLLFNFVDGDREGRYGCMQGLIEIGFLDEAARFNSDPEQWIAGMAIWYLGMAGHVPTIELIERTIREGVDFERFGESRLRDGLARSETSAAEEAMLRIVLDHRMLPHNSKYFVSNFVSTLATRGRREIEPVLLDLLSSQEHWDSVAYAAVVLRISWLIGPLRQLRYPQTPNDDWNYHREGLQRWVAQLERRSRDV